VILAALAEIRREPLDDPYAAVVVDEVQDLTLAGVRLLHAIVGDKPDGLLLIGDGQQKVYPGGFRLADAGVNIRGRAKVLRMNYRNGSVIFDFAQRFLGGETFDDIEDGQADRGDVVLGDRHGEVIEVVRSRASDLDRALLSAIEALRDNPEQRGSAAILCAKRADVAHYMGLLEKAKIRRQNLTYYDGRTSSAVKVGTFLRAKGLEFKHVFLPRYNEYPAGAERGGLADADWLAASRKQVYVGMTRARDALWLGTVSSGG
jgi:superfamily I DNA/RNA helicase